MRPSADTMWNKREHKKGQAAAFRSHIMARMLHDGLSRVHEVVFKIIMLVLTGYPGQSEDMVSWSTGLQEDLLRTNWIAVVFTLPGWLCLCVRGRIPVWRGSSILPCRSNI